MKKPKDLKIVVGINSLTEAQYPAYNNHIKFFFNLGKSGYQVMLVNPCRVAIDNMRNMAVQATLGSGADYLLFLDDDVLVQPDALDKLIACDADIAAGDVIIRGYPFAHMCFRRKGGVMTLVQDWPKNHKKVEPVGSVGNSLTLIKRSLLEKVKPPYFVTGANNTEDSYFCVKAADTVPGCKIVVETTVLCGHIMGPEVIEPGTKNEYRKYLEKIQPAIKGVKTVKTIKLVKVNSNITYEDVLTPGRAEELEKAYQKTQVGQVGNA